MLGPGILAPLVKSFEDTYSLSHSQMASLLSAGGVLATIAAVISGVAFDRYGPRLIVSLSMVLCALSACAMWRTRAASTFAMALLLFFFASGLSAAVNAFVPSLYGQEPLRGLTLSHGLQGVGNLVAPLAVALAIRTTTKWNSVFAVSAITYVFLGLAFLVGVKDVPGSASSSSEGRGPELVKALPPHHLSERQGTTRHLDSAMLVGLLGFVFIPSSEGTIKTWMPNFLQTEAGFSQTVALLALTFIMLGYTGIRIYLGLKSRGNNRVFLLFCMFLFLISFSVVVNAHNDLVLFLSSSLLGFSFGAYWPSMAAALYGRAPEKRGVTTALMSLSSAAGGFLSLNIFGWLADLFSLGRALLLAPASAIAFTIIYWRLTAENEQIGFNL